MTNNRLEHKQGTPRSTKSFSAGKDWKRVKDREEELRTISPLFKKMEGVYPQEPSPQEWKTLSQKLSEELGSYNAPLFRTVKDKLTATDAPLAHWFWIIVALVLLAIIAGIVTVSIGIGDLTLGEAYSKASSEKVVIEVVKTA